MKTDKRDNGSYGASRDKGHHMKDKKSSRYKNLQMREEIDKLKELKTQLPELSSDDLKNFSDLPLSGKTLFGLKKAGFTVPTKVQRQSLIYSLGGSDVVAAAKTGSGKTLAFIIPILEHLYCNTWTQMDGLGALVVTPVRELAYQIFDVLNKVGKGHDFSAGLVIGGTHLEFEWQRVRNCNIVICTPGRLLQHMTENPDFNSENVQMLVLDEADQCLSMGFAEVMNTILEELPPGRQTLLFSATQTRDVKDLIRAGCKNPVFCSVHEHSKTTTPKGLDESYVVREAHEKFTFLWSFITYHKKQKILVFLSTCKQVKYMNNIFCKLRPGFTVMGLHGGMQQLKRMAIYTQFCQKQSAILFATDVAARGLDIPAVHWVVQADCPEDVTTYIHRAGRTARYSNTGEALLILTPSEEPTMVAALKAKNIPIQQIFVDAKKQYSVNMKVEIILSKYPNLKEDAVRAFKSYIKHIMQMKNKKVFNVLSLDRDSYARSLGLIVTPRVRFLEKLLKQKFGNTDGKVENKASSAADTKLDPRKTMDFGGDETDDEDDSFMVSAKNQPEIKVEDYVKEKPISKNKKRQTKEDVAKKLIRKGIQVGKITEFDDEGNAILDSNKVQICEAAQAEGPNSGIDIDKLRSIIREEDQMDKKLHNAKIKQKKKEKKWKIKEERRKEREQVKAEEEDGEEEEEEEEEDSDVDSVTQEIIDSLPDPDKIYGQKSGSGSDEEDSDAEEAEESESAEEESSDEEDEESSDEESAEEGPKLSGKRKAIAKYREAKRAKQNQPSTLSELPVDEQEQLALFLLSGKT